MSRFQLLSLSAMLKILTATRNALGRKYTNSKAHAFSTLPVIVHRRNTSELQNRYEPGGYHLVLPGEVYNQRYRVIRKLGWGQYSTVWLVKDIQAQRLVAMKVLVGELSIPDQRGNWDELAMLKIIREKNPQSLGYRHIPQLLDNFTQQGPNGSHICLILEAMNLSVFDIYLAFSGPMPLQLLKRVSKHILRALQYLHDECDIIHTDIKGDNIFMADTPPVEERVDIKLSDDYLMAATFKLGDLGEASIMENRFADMIQPECLRSPEVIIGADWDVKADIWNLGCLIYEFARGTKLFDPEWKNEESGMNSTETHLAQMTGLSGDFPSELLDSGRRSKLYFDDQGSLLKGAGRYSISLEELLNRAGHSPQDVYEVATFLSHMLVINPKERWPAAKLLDHPWLRDVK